MITFQVIGILVTIIIAIVVIVLTVLTLLDYIAVISNKESKELRDKIKIQRGRLVITKTDINYILKEYATNNNNSFVIFELNKLHKKLEETLEVL